VKRLVKSDFLAVSTQKAICRPSFSRAHRGTYSALQYPELDLEVRAWEGRKEGGKESGGEMGEMGVYRKKEVGRGRIWGNRQWIRKGKEIGGMGRLGRRKGLVE